LGKVAEEVKANSAAIRTVSSRVETVASEQAKQSAAIRKEMAERKKRDNAQGRDFQQKLQWLLLLPLLIKPKSEQIIAKVGEDDRGPVEKNIKVLVEDDDSFSQLLPLLMIGGMGGGGIGGSGTDGSSDSMMPLLLLLTLGKR
jgi:hypothetical protein